MSMFHGSLVMHGSLTWSQSTPQTEVRKLKSAIDEIYFIGHTLHIVTIQTVQSPAFL